MNCRQQKSIGALSIATNQQCFKASRQVWHDIYRRYISDIYPIFLSSKISDIFDIFKIGYFPYFFNINLLLAGKTSNKMQK